MASTDQLIKTLLQEMKDTTTTYALLGTQTDSDIEALCFLVLMQAAKSAQEDLKAIMAQVKAINREKAKLRELMSASAENLLFSHRQKLSDKQLKVIIAYLMNPC